MSVPNFNLINFEHPTSRRSSFILTSPKSLRACQKAGVKPVELLYKSLADVKKEVGKDKAQEVYQQLEKERQQKLERCRKIRNELLMEGYPQLSRKSSVRKEFEMSERSGTPEASSRGTNNSRAQQSAFVPLVPIDTEAALQQLRSENRRSDSIEQFTPLLPALTNSTVNPFIGDETRIKPEEKPASSKSSLSRSGRNKKKSNRSHSLPSRSETPKETSRPSKTTSNPSRKASSLGSYVGSALNGFGQRKNTPDRSRSVLSHNEMPLIERKIDNRVSSEDVNNNRYKSQPLMRPTSARRIRNAEKKKIHDCRKMYEKILAQYKDPEYCLLKYRQIIGNSVERELREQEVKNVQRRIEEGYEMWQDKVLMLQWLDSERADEQVTARVATQIEKMKQKQRNKEIVHAINLNKVKEEDDIRAEILRREMAKKERKIQVLHEEKERVISESKSRALAVSELKEQIRNIMTPETFDQKASKCGRIKSAVRVFYPPQMCPNIMQQSHISLG